MSPTPGRSTLITSAPNHASNCVQVGPDCTWVKSRMRTPFSALVIALTPVSSLAPACAGMNKDEGRRGPRPMIELFLLQRADQGRLAGIHRRVDRALQLVRRRRIHADAAEGFHHLVIARALDEHGGR